MSVTGAVTVPSLLHKVRQIQPALRACAADAERDRRLPDAVFQAMHEQGLYRLWKPKLFGGLEADPITAFQVFEEVSRIDSAAGWNLQLSCGAEMFGAWFSDEGAQEAFGNADSALAGAFFPPRKAIPVDGGYRVTGQTAFMSGAHHAGWFLGLSNIYDGGDAPRLGENGEPVTLMTMCPAADATIVDTWRTLGMRGTGSHDVLMKDVFVPERRTAVLAPLEKPGRAYEGPLYKLTLWATVSALSTVALGVARAAIDSLLELAARKIPSYTARALRDRNTVQALVGEAEATLGAARAFLHEALREAWDEALQGRVIDMPRKMKLQLAATHAAASAAKTVDMVHAAAGTTGIREEHRLQRHFRDVHTITQHAFISANRYESGGQFLLGVPIEWPFYGL
jgi:alkylation response protein AidB-like acyl-CoA dehydrogenase